MSKPLASQRMRSPYAQRKPLFTVLLGATVLLMAAFERKLQLKLSNCNHGSVCVDMREGKYSHIKAALVVCHARLILQGLLLKNIGVM